LGIRRVCVPAQAGALSALGLAVAVPAVSVSRSVVAGGRLAAWRGVFGTLEHEAGAALARLSGAAATRVERSADVRYASQSWALTVPWPADGRIERAFTAAHRARFGFVASEPVAVVTLRVRAIGPEGRRPVPAPACGAGGPLPQAVDTVLDDGTDARVPVVERASLAIGADLVGPAILVQQDATTWVAAGWRGTVGPAFDMCLERP
jgi:N-methylhydantoinase A/oxoprolinase/acetone carboxylase beta subunit